MISWAAVNKIAERQGASDPKYREQLAGRPLRSDAKVLTDEELLAKLRSFGVELDHASLEQLCEKALSAEEIARPLLKQQVFKSKQEELESDWIWICLTDLWRRWFPEKPCFELLDDKMQEGYDLLKSKKREAACSLWVDAWSNVLNIFDKTGMQSVDEFDEQFGGSQSLYNWLQDLEMELWNAGLQNRPFLTARISLCEEILRKFSPDRAGKDHDFTTGNWKRALAETYFEIGEIGKAEALYREWLDNDPQWGCGWIGWSDCYFFGQPSAKDLERSERLLQEGLSVVGVRNRLDLLERLTGVYDQQGQTDKAEELRQQIRDSASVLQANHYFRSGGIFGQKIASDEVPLFSTTDTMLATTSRPASARKHKIGRNEPCPCRSGKKFKKCCGRGVF